MLINMTNSCVFINAIIVPQFNGSSCWSMINKTPPIKVSCVVVKGLIRRFWSQYSGHVRLLLRLPVCSKVQCVFFSNCKTTSQSSWNGIVLKTFSKCCLVRERTKHLRSLSFVGRVKKNSEEQLRILCKDSG